MRKIKFRGKRIDNGEWVYGLPSLNARYYAIRWNDSGAFRSPSVIRKTVGQFIGLHDKNGKEIYEGDIILSRAYQANPLKVEYKNEYSSFGAFAIKKGYSGIINLGSLNLSDYEVIGNIHDNPELLEIEKEGE